VPSSRRITSTTVATFVAFGLLAAACGGGSGGDQASTATTFVVDATARNGMQTMVEQSNQAALLTASGHGEPLAATCVTTWADIRPRVARYAPATAATLDRAVAALAAAVRARDQLGATSAAAAIATAVAGYTRLYP
jgi:hypothetical protein